MVQSNFSKKDIYDRFLPKLSAVIKKRSGCDSEKEEGYNKEIDILLLEMNKALGMVDNPSNFTVNV